MELFIFKIDFLSRGWLQFNSVLVALYNLRPQVYFLDIEELKGYGFFTQMCFGLHQRFSIGFLLILIS